MLLSFFVFGKHYFLFYLATTISLNFFCVIIFCFRERDSDRDGKVNFKEFFHGLFGLVRNYDEEGHNSSHESGDTLEAPAKILFAQLDKDGDG